VSFNEPVGPAIEMDSTFTALDLFNVTFGNDIMELLVEKQTHMPCKICLVPGTRDNGTTLYEMYLFLGIIIAMGVHKLPNFAHYWSSDCLLGVPGISAGMPTDQLKALLRCFHLNDNMNRFQGQKVMKQYMPMKHTKRDKVWCWCSPNGMMVDLRGVPRVCSKSGKRDQLEHCYCPSFGKICVQQRTPLIF
jgi:hypothetical protein